MYTYTDYFDRYGRIMQFNKNKTEAIHRWYPFVEGYSKEFIESIISESEKVPELCLEPFSGSGTTALELQNRGLKCYSFEVNPLMYLIAKVKLETEYDIDEIHNYLNEITINRQNINDIKLKTEFKTLYENKQTKKWNYHNEAAIAIEKLKGVLERIDETKYKDLFTVALASILLESSNMYRNGKCLSYKKNWKNHIVTEAEVFQKFDNKVLMQLEDIINRDKNFIVYNKSFLFNEDARTGIASLVEDNSVDLVITSPPYLNSRDYTDTYMLELKTLGFTVTLDEIKRLREKTLRSHVQIKWKDDTYISNARLMETLEDLKTAEGKVSAWNDSIIDMVRLYFIDMKCIFNIIYRKLKYGGKVYFNVSNSAYFNILINTLEICASLAEEEGFFVKEIRKARYLKTSPQQQEKVGKLLEGIILLEK